MITSLLATVQPASRSKWLEQFDKFLSDTRYTPPEVRDIVIGHIGEIMTPNSAI